MSYAQRPMGDYATYGYAGDPGWLSSAFKFIKKKVLPWAGAIIGGPVGVAVGALGGAVAATRKPATPALPPPPGSIGGAVSFPGGTTVSVAGVIPHAGIGAHAPSGYHLDKATRSRWVRNRRMNVANPRALRKAMRRVQGFEKLAKRTITFTRRVKMKK